MKIAIELIAGCLVIACVLEGIWYVAALIVLVIGGLVWGYSTGRY